MAILKEIILENGIKTNYHRIGEAHFNLIESQALIKIYSYISEEYRNEEKKIDSLTKIINALTLQYNQALNNKDSQMVDSFYNKIEESKIQRDNLLSKQFYVSSSIITLDLIPDDLSLNNLYRLITTLDTYSNSKEV